MLERELKRYAAYFRGWCQAFGEHKHFHGDQSGIDWLLADHQVGMVLPRELIKPLRREVLLHRKPPALIFSSHQIRVGSLTIDLEEDVGQRAMRALGTILSDRRGVHFYLTSHLLYGQGNRILTFSNKKPLIIIYKEIGKMRLRLESP